LRRDGRGRLGALADAFGARPEAELDQEHVAETEAPAQVGADPAAYPVAALRGLPQPGGGLPRLRLEVRLLGEELPGCARQRRG
jgi:hypothetical protein